MRNKPGPDWGIKLALDKVTTMGAKTYNREVCMIKKSGQDINLEMVQEGYAWAYGQYLKRPYASDYIDAERNARDKRLGLWKDSNPMPPWEFRKMQRRSERREAQ